MAAIRAVINTDAPETDVHRAWCHNDAGEWDRSGCIVGSVSAEEGLTAGTTYVVRVAGVRNPRYVVLEKDQKLWSVRTYDYAVVDGEAKPDDQENLIDKGTGGNRAVAVASAIPTFGIEPSDTTNGAVTDYSITWYSEVETAEKDQIIIPFPAEVLLTTQAVK